MVQALDVDAIQKAWNHYFVLIGVEQVKRGDEAKAVAEGQRLKMEAESKRGREISIAQKAFDAKKQKIEDEHVAQLGVIENDVSGARSIANEATQATKDHQDKVEKTLGVRPNIPQGAAPAVRRTNM